MRLLTVRLILRLITTQIIPEKAGIDYRGYHVRQIKYHLKRQVLISTVVAFNKTNTI